MDGTSIETTGQLYWILAAWSNPQAFVCVCLFCVRRVVADHAALVPDVVCQRGGHPPAAEDLGPALLPGLAGSLSGHAGHAQDQGT